ncbi:MAG TPA: hypothetical protein VIK91_28390 [Nannocystis sp.]
MRTLLSLAFLALVLWASCTVKLGAYTLAEHVDRIGETEQAKELLEGTRGRITPLLEDMKQRIFGEYVEAPTRTRADLPPPRAKPPRPAQAALPTRVGDARKDDGSAEKKTAPASAPGPSRAPSSPEAARLPGKRRASSHEGR